MAFKSFIETQFPIAKLSAESYKERKANYSQTLTGLGKWWGRKPLVLVRASILGLLLPSTDDPKRDREIFLRIMTMDDEGLRRRRNKNFTGKDIFQRATVAERLEWFTEDSSAPRLKRGLSAEEKELIQNTIFSRLPYSEKLEYCLRPENLDGPSEAAWLEINAHLGTTAQSLPELIKQLGEKQFGHTPKVGDAFCGGGSIPFEAARIGCEALGFDLNPVGCLLSWAAVNLVGGGQELAKNLRKNQEIIWAKLEKIISELGFESIDGRGRADAFIYCHEVVCPETGWRVPLSPHWVIAAKYGVVAKLIPNQSEKKYDLEIKTGVSSSELAEAKATGTLKNSRVVHPMLPDGVPISMIRTLAESSVNGELRAWRNEDIVPTEGDVFQERLYCVRYLCEEGEQGAVETEDGWRAYRTPTSDDLARESLVENYVRGHLNEWQKNGWLPKMQIEMGDETTRLRRERGWTCWHHLFNPRQLLLNGLLMKLIAELENLPIEIKTGLVLRVGVCSNWNSRLVIWNSDVSKGPGSTEQVFVNQALNTQWNYGCRTTFTLKRSFFGEELAVANCASGSIRPSDARDISETCDFWITDPPYADAVSYHELADYFLAWYEQFIRINFPDWATDGKKALAIKGSDQRFKTSMVQSYRNLNLHMSEAGGQIVMFTHQDARVWADLTLVLWASGLCVSSAWCIATETDNGLRQGNYVQGTVLLILRKQTSNDVAFLDEIYPRIETEVQEQLSEMRSVEDSSEPNFGDSDYQLAAYAAALRVLTQYKAIEDIDVVAELTREREGRGSSAVEKVIENAVRVACEFLVPQGFESSTWRTISPVERFYLKGLEVESHGEFRAGVYQELARGFGVRDYQFMLSSERANQTRLKNATEFASRSLDDTGFGASPTRQVLFAIREIVRNEDDVQFGKNWLKNEVRDYWSLRKHLINISRYLAQVGQFLEGWEKDANAARLLAGALENDHA